MNRFARFVRDYWCLMLGRPLYATETDVEIARLHAQSADMERGELELMEEVRSKKS